MQLALSINALALERLLAPYLPDGVRISFFFDPVLKIGIHAHGQYIKGKVALMAVDGALRLDLKSVLLNGLPVGGPMWERYIPAGQYGPITLNHHDGGLRLFCPGVRFRPSGVLNGLLSISADV